jgi:hypothetical protein
MSEHDASKRQFNTVFKQHAVTDCGALPVAHIAVKLSKDFSKDLPTPLET